MCGTLANLSHGKHLGEGEGERPASLDAPELVRRRGGMAWLWPAPWTQASAEDSFKATPRSVSGASTPRLGDISRNTSPLSETSSPRSDISQRADRLPPALVGSVSDWLERVKKGYGRFAVAFEALGIEDTNDIHNIDRTIFEQVETLLRDGCGAKSMHLKNIHIALLEYGCNLRTASEEATAAEGGVPFLALKDAKGRLAPVGASHAAAASGSGAEPESAAPHVASVAPNLPPMPPPPRPLLRQSDSSVARAQQWDEVVSAMAAQATGSGLWNRLARGVETEQELLDFFRRRQVMTADDL